MTIEPPLHSPEDPGERKRDLGSVLMTVGAVLLFADILALIFLPAAIRGEGGRLAMLVIGLDALAAIALLIVGFFIKQKADRQGT